MICASSIFEVRYKPILDFSLISRGLLAPFSRLANNLNIVNEGNINQIIRFDFIEDKFIIYFNWTSAVLWSDTNTEILVSSNNSPLKIFFDILDKIKSLESFGGITNYLVQNDYLIKKDEDDDLGIIFREKFLQTTEIFTSNHPNNYEIAWIDKQDNKEEEILLRTYRSDLAHTRQNNFFQIDQLAANSQNPENGYHYGYKLFEIGSKIDLKKLKNTHQRAVAIYQKLGI